ncbi:YbaB/EbfC family nucleoid-associated protein [Nocardia sp. NPDC050712]|uniref:YbaB/EbfC family nucleoid-associated protein n=1 Tax=Nocardia sp. NPDC050712 TaxID=3155518 RepID=UPI0033EE554C
MANEIVKEQMVAVLEGVQQQFRTIARIQQSRAALTASATARKRVTVTVNASGTIIETKFGSGIEDLSYSEIARAITEAAQQAHAEVGRKTEELMAPLQQQRARLPKLSDLVEGMPDLSPPELPPVSLAPPGSPERAAADSAMTFSAVDTPLVEADGRGVTDSSW